MKTILTPHLLKFLVDEGYSFFLSKTIVADFQNPRLSISLVPVKNRPVINKYSLVYKAYFNLNQRFWQSVLSTSARVWVVLQPEDVCKLKRVCLDVMQNGSLNSRRISGGHLKRVR